MINAREISTNAGRDLVEKVQRREDVTLYIQTNLDIKGIGIAEDAGKPAPSGNSGVRHGSSGVTFEDVELYDLPVESWSCKKSSMTELKNRFDDGKVDGKVFNSLRKDGGRKTSGERWKPSSGK